MSQLKLKEAKNKLHTWPVQTFVEQSVYTIFWATSKQRKIVQVLVIYLLNIGFFEFPLFGQSKLSGRPIAAQYRGDGIKSKYDGRTAVGETGKN